MTETKKIVKSEHENLKWSEHILTASSSSLIYRHFWGFFHLLTKSVECEFKTNFLSKLTAARMRAAKKVCVRHNISVMQLFCV